MRGYDSRPGFKKRLFTEDQRGGCAAHVNILDHVLALVVEALNRRVGKLLTSALHFYGDFQAGSARSQCRFIAVHYNFVITRFNCRPGNYRGFGKGDLVGRCRERHKRERG